MPRFIRSLVLFTTASAAIVISSLLMTAASAQPSHALCEISDEYRNATVDFERHVYRAKYFDSYDERLADRLECAAREFRSAAKNPNDIRRLLYHWQDLTALHVRSQELLVNAHADCDPELLRCWQPVAETFACLVEEMRCLAAGGHDRPYPGFSGAPGIYGPERLHGTERLYGPDRPYGPEPLYVPERLERGSEFGMRPEGNLGYAVPRGSAGPLGTQAPLRNQPSLGGNRAAVQLRPQVFSDPSQRGVPVDPGRELGAAIAATILNRLLN
jgi:hypothetical protein